MRTLFIFINILILNITVLAQVWKPLDGGISATPTAITSNDHLIATAEFLGREKSYNVHQVSIWNGYYWLKLPKIYADTFSIITQLKFYNKSLYIGGRFNQVLGMPNAKHIIRWRDRSYDDLSAVSSKINNFSAVRGLNIYNGLLVISGGFQTNAAQYGDNIAIYNGTNVITSSSAVLGTGISGSLSSVFSNEDNILVFGGRLKTANDTQAYELAYIKDNRWFRCDSTGLVPTHLSELNGKVVLGAYALNTKITGFYLADSTSIDSLNNGLDEVSEIFDLVNVDGILYASGTFYLKGKDASVQLIQFKNNSWQELPNGALAGPRKLTSHKATLITSGFFTFYSLVNYNHIAQYLPDHGVAYGKIYFDKDKNCMFNFRDENLNTMNLVVNSGDYFIKPLENGLYLQILPFGNYEIRIIPEKGWNSVSCSSNTKTFKLNKDSSTQEIDFPMIQQVGLRDLNIKLSSFSGWSVDKTKRIAYAIRYANKGSENVANTRVVLHYDSKLGDLNATPSPDLQQGDSAVWLVSDLFAGESRTISCSFSIDQNSTDNLELSASIDLEEDETETSDNESHLSQSLADTDYEFKKEIQYISGDTAYITSEQSSIEYQISFANFTTDTIKDVYVIDTIKLNHDLSIIQTTAASHPVSSEAFPGAIGEDIGIIVWTFKDINLLPNPDQNPEIVANRGFVSFKLGLSGSLQEGTILRNKGDVVFDYYEAEQTNWVYAMVDNSTIGIPSIPSQRIMCYPNPSSSSINFEVVGLHDANFTILSINGSLVKSGKLKNHSVSVEDLEAGLYVIQLQTKDSLFQSKFIKY